ncbi:nucleotidyltransferase family protein [bacterium]|nr:nucleotidyltransferase family protein [bacterium]
MKALILAAGLGTRLKPFTDKMPKALVTFDNKPIIDFLIEKLFKSGINEIAVNLHHYSNTLKKYLIENNIFNVNFYFSDESNLLLDTGGAIKKASDFLNNNEPFFVHNVDVFSNIDLNEMYDFHLKSGNLVTIAVRNRYTSRYFLFDSENVLCGWRNTKTNEEIITRNNLSEYYQLAFSGIQIINSEVFEMMPTENKFSLVDLYVKLSSNNKIGAYIHNNDYWFDLGTIEKIKEAENYFAKSQ